MARELDNVILDDIANDGKWQCPAVGRKYYRSGKPCKTKDSLYRHFRTVSFPLIDEKKERERLTDM